MRTFYDDTLTLHKPIFSTSSFGLRTGRCAVGSCFSLAPA